MGVQGAPGVGWRGSGVARWLPGAAKVARDCQESDSGDLGSPGISQEVFRWPEGARSRIVGAWGLLVPARRFPGAQGSPGVG